MLSKSVLIRGLNRDVYNQLIGKAKEQGKNVGELVNEAMRVFLQNGIDKEEIVDPRKLVVSGSVTLSKDDIEGIYDEVGKFKVENSGELFFDEDVDRETLQLVEKIYNKGKLHVPRKIHPYTLIKIGHVKGQVKKY